MTVADSVHRLAAQAAMSAGEDAEQRRQDVLSAAGESDPGLLLEQATQDELDVCGMGADTDVSGARDTRDTRLSPGRLEAGGHGG